MLNFPKYRYLNYLWSTIGTIQNHKCLTIWTYILDMFKMWTHLNRSCWQTRPNNPPIRWMLSFMGKGKLGKPQLWPFYKIHKMSVSWKKIKQNRMKHCCSEQTTQRYNLPIGNSPEEMLPICQFIRTMLSIVSSQHCKDYNKVIIWPCCHYQP